MTPTALVVGGGIAGPVAAMALQKAGFEAKLYEAYPPTDGDVGSVFTVTANGLEALRVIDALDIALEAGFPTRRNVLWNQSGRKLVSLPLDSRVPGSPFAHTMKRSRLAKLLRDEASRRGIPIAYEHRLVEAITTTDGARARFANGATAEGRLIVGADGVHSVVRKAIDPLAPAGRYVGLTNFGGLTRDAADGMEPEAWHLIFGRRAFFGYHATPTGDVIWFANVPRPLITPEERASTSHDAWRSWLVEQFRGDAGPAVELIEAGELELAADNTHDLPHVPKWHRGGLVIVGDAAHAPSPTSGQGASMAIEDGVVLARSLRDTQTNAAAFARFESLRRERVERIVAYGARGSANKAPGPIGRVFRDLMLRVFLRSAANERALSWMYDYRIDWNDGMDSVGQAA